MLQFTFTSKASNIKEYLTLLNSLAKPGKEYNKEFIELCADAMLNNKYGMVKRAFSEEADPATGIKWKILSDSWQKVRKSLKRSPDSEKLVFGFERVPAEWTSENGKRKKAKSATWRSSGGVGLYKSIQRSEYNNGKIAIGTNDPKGKIHNTEGAGRGKIIRKFLGIGTKDRELFKMVFERIYAKLKAQVGK